MQDLAYWQEKIQQKRKQTSWREFLLEICSRYSLDIYKVDEMLSRYPNTERKWIIVNDKYASMNNEDTDEYTWDFFADFSRFYTKSKRSNLIFTLENENADYTDSGYGMKNCYLSFWLWNGVENWLYSVVSQLNCTNIINSLCVNYNSSNIFESKNIRQSFNVFYSANIDNSSDLWFCSNCIGCHNCIDCDNLINQSYCIDNIQLTKEEYFVKQKKLMQDKSEFSSKKSSVFLKMGNINSKNSKGLGIVNSENITKGYLVFNSKDSKNVILLEWGNAGCSDFYDCIDVGNNSKDYYATTKRGTDCEQLYCCYFGGEWCSHCYYSMNLDTCSFCLGCIGMRNKSFCIFNRQYTKEERHKKVDEIFTEMGKSWTLWQFFPATMNPFYFNDTAAYLIDPSFTKEEVEAKGYLRRDEPIKVDIPADLEQVNVSELDKYEGFDENGKWYIDEAILKKVILDEQGNARRIVNMEYAFLVKYGLPLPRKHWLDRMKENFKIG